MCVAELFMGSLESARLTPPRKEWQTWVDLIQGSLVPQICEYVRYRPSPVSPLLGPMMVVYDCLTAMCIYFLTQSHRKQTGPESIFVKKDLAENSQAKSRFVAAVAVNVHHKTEQLRFIACLLDNGCCYF